MSTPPLALDADVWRDRARRHAQRVDGWTADHLARATTGRRHPVEDFLFRYYSYRPGQLRRWHAGLATALLGDEANEHLDWPTHARVDAVDTTGREVIGVGLDVVAYFGRHEARVTSIARLLRATAARAPQLGCFGLHEWAMVYRQSGGDRRHAEWPLRLGQGGTDEVVEAHPLRCTHFDAFRFFTEPARSLNAVQPTRQVQVALEQPGCLHAGLDLYKFAYQLSAAAGSDLVADCFAFARDVREVDMRASPYDLRGLGLEPVPVETVSGRAEYVRLQRGFMARGQGLRTRLVAVCEALVAAQDRAC